VEQQRDVAVVLDAQPAVMDAPVHLAGNLLGGQVLQATIVGQLIPFPIQGLLAARAFEACPERSRRNEHHSTAPGLADDTVGGHEDGVYPSASLRTGFVLGRRFGQQDKDHGDGWTVATVGHGTLS